MDDALRLAEELKKFWGDYASLEKVNRAADLLRSQHAEIAKLRAEVERLRTEMNLLRARVVFALRDDAAIAEKEVKE